MEMNFCRRCGSRLTDKTNGVYVCENGHTLFANSAPTVGMFFVTDDNQILLSVRGIEPLKGMLDTPGGFVDSAETFEEALARELQEELGLDDSQYETPKYLCSASSEYLYQNENRNVLTVFFWSKLHPGAQPVADDDVADIKFAPVNDINIDEIGGRDIKTALAKIREILL
ncbi:MAG: NUDIX domain-containing protein [Candidatus Saccharimonadales bacterium]